VAESISPTAEEIYWKESLLEPYYAGQFIEYYAPAFAGWEAACAMTAQLRDAEAELAPPNLSRSELDPTWQEVSPAAHAAWNRVDRNWTSVI
jgi:hypothetical protein